MPTSSLPSNGGCARLQVGGDRLHRQHQHGVLAHAAVTGQRPGMTVDVLQRLSFWRLPRPPHRRRPSSTLLRSASPEAGQTRTAVAYSWDSRRNQLTRTPWA